MSLSALAASSGVSTIGVAIRGDSSDLSRALAKSSAEITAFERTGTGVASRWGSSWKLAAAGVTAGLVAVAAGLVSAGLAAVDFDTKMRNVNSLLALQAGEFAALSAEVLALSKSMPQSAETLADGLYNIASSGFAGADGMLVLEASARAATAGLSTTDTAAQSIAAVLNAYGLSAASAGDVSDTLFQTVNKGVVSFDELAGVVGNFVGLTAAANIPIQDASAALATMTLAGIGAAEASTSLNRLTQSLIQPSEALSAVLADLGYSSGLSALEAEGLYGVMDKLRGVTQGNAEAYLRLFPEIRAARGAFALAANDGQNYLNTQEQIAEGSNRLGATQAALDEQLQATSAKWELLRSTLVGNTIEIGQQVLPVFDQLIAIVTPFADGTVPALRDAWAAIAPYMATVRDIGGDLLDVLGGLVDAALPLAAGLAQVAGALAGLGLEVVLDTLKAVTGVMADNQLAVVLLAGVYASRFLPSVTQAITGLKNFGTGLLTSAGSLRTHMAEQIRYQQVLHQGAVLNGQATGQLSNFRAGLSATRTSVRGLASSFAASGIATAALTAGIAALSYALATAGQAMRESMAEITGSVDTFDLSSLEDATKQINDVKTSLGGVASEGEKFDKWYEYLVPASAFVDMFNDYRHNKDLDATYEALDEIGGKLANANLNLSQLARETGVDVTRLRQIVEAQRIDITDAVSTEDAAASREQVKQYLADVEATTGVGVDAIAANFGEGVESIEAISKAIEEAAQRATSAFAAATDVLGTWKPNIGVEEEADAVEQLAEARAELNELQRDGEATGDRLADAQKRVADAQEALDEARAAKANGTLEAFYRNALDTATSFSTNLDRAVELGLDPTVVARLLEEGPAQAGPIVQAMVNDNSGALVQMVNDSEAALAEINERIVLQSRLTQLAINSSTDEMAKSLPDALRISAASSADGATPESVAKVLGMDEATVRQVADLFGITFAGGMDAALVANSPASSGAVVFGDRLGFTASNAQAIGSAFGGDISAAMWKAINSGAPLPGTAAQAAASGIGGGRFVQGYAYGGIYPGYTPGRDIGLIAVSGGEAIMRPEFARAVGPAWVDRMNYAARVGGVDAIRSAMMPYLGGFANGGTVRVETVPVPVYQTSHTEAPISIGTVVANDPGAIVAAARRSRVRRSIGGRRSG